MSTSPLITDSQFLKREFAKEARKSKLWVREMIQRGSIPGIIVENEVFVDYFKWLEMRGIPHDTGVSEDEDRIAAECRRLLSY